MKLTCHSFSKGSNRQIALGLTAILLALAHVAHYFTASAQSTPTDPSLLTAEYSRVRLVHSNDATLIGATGYFRDRDPFLLYQLGRDLINRQFSFAEGVYGAVGDLTVPLYVGGTVEPSKQGSDARFARDHTASCLACHSIPFREPGGGQTIQSTGGMGRNTPHFFGAGLVEMLAEQTRAKILNQYDLNRNGLIDRAEITGGPVLIAPAPRAAVINYGSLSPGPNGLPALNPIFRVWFVGPDGKVLCDAAGMNDPRVAAFDFALQPFGWGRGYHQSDDGRVVPQGAEASTLRAIYTLAADVHLGLQAFDPTQQATLENNCRSLSAGGRAKVSLSGAQQYDFGAVPDLGNTTTATGVSLDDPDQDGVVTELTEGDVDAAEFYMLHAPAPAVKTSVGGEKGRAVLRRTGCTSCHVEDWEIEPRNEAKGLTGDRRLFNLATQSLADKTGSTQVAGVLEPLFTRKNGVYQALYHSFRVERIYSDFKHWDIGPGFYERRFDGSLQREHRTAPLWGVGSTAPYGHNGKYLSLDDVILAHGGAAIVQRNAYKALTPTSKKWLLQYLETLILYSTDLIPADIDGNGVASSNFTINNQFVGYERFDPRFLSSVPPNYRKLYEVTDYMGRRVPLQFMRNMQEVYGLDLPYRSDANGDLFPDILGLIPNVNQSPHGK